MKFIVKSFLLILGFITILFVSACNSNNVQDYPVEEGATTIKFWSRSFSDWADALLEAEVKEFNENLTDGIQIDLKFYGDDNTYDTAIAAGFENGTVADILNAQYDRIYTYIKSGYIAPVGDYLSDEIKNGYIETAREAVTFLEGKSGEEKMYAMPWTLEPSMMLFYRKDYFQKAGITEAPTTWDELLDCCAKIQPLMNKQKNQYTIVIPTTAVEYTWTTFGMIQNVTGGQVVDNTWKVNRLTETDPNFKKCAKFWYDIAKNGYAPIQAITPAGYVDNVEALAEDKAAMAICGSFGITHLMNYYQDLVNEDLFGVTAMPMPGGNDVNTCTTVNGGWTYVISSNMTDEKAAKAAKFLEWLLCDKEVASRYFDKAYYGVSSTRTEIIDYINEQTIDSNISDWIQTVNAVGSSAMMVPSTSWSVSYTFGSLFEFMANHATEKSFDELYSQKVRETIDNINSIISQPGYSANPKYR